MNPNVTATSKDWLLIALLALIWGGSFLFGRILMLEWPPFTVVFLRVALAALALWVFVWASGRKFLFSLSFAAALLAMGILNNAIPFSLILIGQQEIGSGLAALVNAMTPIWTLIIANALTADEKFSGNRIIGILLGFVGVTVLIGADLLAGLHASAWAQAAVLGATISYGFASVFGKRFRKIDPIMVATGQLTAATLVMFPIMVFSEGFFMIGWPDLELALSMIALAVLCTALAYVLFFTVLASAGATNVSLVTFLVPVSAILLGNFWLGESLTAANVMGMGLILAGLVFIDGRMTRIFS